MTRPSNDETFLEIAATLAKRTTCLRRAVGCVVVDKMNHVLATGYNGVAVGEKHCNEVTGANCSYRAETNETLSIPIHGHACEGARSVSGSGLDSCKAIHAEQNALLQCKNVYEIDTIYCTVTPCITCTKLLKQTSCRKIVFTEPYAPEHMERFFTEWSGVNIKGEERVWGGYSGCADD